MKPKVKTSITDKNGKKTTVHRNVIDLTASTVTRAAQAPAAAPSTEWVVPEKKTATEMKEYAKSIHADAVANLVDGKWIIEIDTGFEESNVLSERFKGTPAYEANDTYSRSFGGSELDEWADNNGARYQPIEVVAELYNMAVARVPLAREWYNMKAKEAGLRSYEEIIKAEEGTVTEGDRNLITNHGYFALSNNKEYHEFERGCLKEYYDRLEEMGW